ncbi:hypothetical protein GEV33_004260 [Tenebrio molitor]|uniref:Uncharacterized protein n=1 Tax=Tenebrio molitor TaxID=7067 RepID=A0A8J6HR73_TENMO|nr:hypothetical protein GEV33_004260 [Tenebrio molitor]
MRCSCNHRDALLQRKIRSSYFKSRSATAERAAVSQVARCELRAWRSGYAIIPESGLPIATVLIVRRCQASGPSRSPKSLPLPLPITDYRIPLSRDPSPSREREGFIVEHPLSTERSRSLEFSIVISLMVHFVRTRQDHAVMPRLVSQA